jgi:hypothetical protein
VSIERELGQTLDWMHSDSLPIPGKTRDRAASDAAPSLSPDPARQYL